MSKIDEIKDLISTKSLEAKHFPIILKILGELGENNEDFQEEIEDLDDANVQIIPTDTSKAWIKIEGGNLTTGEGEIDNPSSTIEAIEPSWIDIFINPKNAGLMHMGGDVKVNGDVSGASTVFQDLIAALLYALDI